MSRIWKLPITLPAGVTLAVAGKKITVKGPKGELSLVLQEVVGVNVEGTEVHVTVSNESNSQNKAFWGLSRALVANMIVGVSQGYKKSLEILGVGYKFESITATTITLAVGFSHKVVLEIPKGVSIAPDAKEKNMIHIEGIDKQLVGYFAALVREVKPPEPYKGKGIRYVGEHVRRKAGKTAAKGGK